MRLESSFSTFVASDCSRLHLKKKNSAREVGEGNKMQRDYDAAAPGLPSICQQLAYTDLVV